MTRCRRCRSYHALAQSCLLGTPVPMESSIGVGPRVPEKPKPIPPCDYCGRAYERKPRCKGCGAAPSKETLYAYAASMTRTVYK